jgi:hypothetical protein
MLIQVGLRQLTPVPWLRFKFLFPPSHELDLNAEMRDTESLSTGKTVDEIMVRKGETTLAILNSTYTISQ